MTEENNESTNVKVARMEVKVENLTRSHQDLKEEVKSHRKETQSSKEEILKEIIKQPEILRSKMGEYFDNTIASHLETVGSELFADKETQLIVKGGIKWWLGSSLFVILSLIVVVAVLIQALKYDQVEHQTISNGRVPTSITAGQDDGL